MSLLGKACLRYDMNFVLMCRTIIIAQLLIILMFLKYNCSSMNVY